MIEFSGAKRGYPWHGLWRQTPGVATGVITTPSGGDVTLPDMLTPSDGDCFLVAVPGMPSVETTPAEAASGQTWLSYALLSGKDSLLYGRNLGRERHIYVDDQGRSWRVLVQLVGTRGDGEIRAYIEVQRLGVVGVSSAPWSAPIELVVSYETSPDYAYGWSAEDIPIRLDINSLGSRMLVGAPRTVGYAAIAEIDLTGSPADGNFSASISLLADEQEDVWAVTNGDDVYVWMQFEEVSPGVWEWTGPYTSDVWPDGPLTYSVLRWTLGSTASHRYIAGARYSSVGAVEVARYEMDYSFSMTPTVSSSGRPAPASQDVVENIRVAVVCGAQSSQISVAQTQHGDGILFGGAADHFSFSGVVTISGMGDIPTFAELGRSPVNALDIYANLIQFPTPNMMIGGRFSNAVYAAVTPAVTIHPALPGTAIWNLSAAMIGPMIGKIGSISTPVIVESVTDSKPNFFATEHPVTGAIATATDQLICWV